MKKVGRSQVLDWSVWLSRGVRDVGTAALVEPEVVADALAVDAGVVGAAGCAEGGDAVVGSHDDVVGQERPGGW